MNSKLTYGSRSAKNLIIGDILSGIILLTFCYTALSKLKEYETFTFIIGKSPLLAGIPNIVGVLLLTLEIIVVIMLFISSVRLKGLYLSLILLCAFILYISYMLIFAFDLPCSCGGVLDSLSWKQHLLLNFVLILIVIGGISSYKRAKSEARQTPP
ncbi:MAG TPA: hypothetical protein PLS00_00225 [Niabella sp.]|nr:hypothetical protein [Niabella sp.]